MTNRTTPGWYPIAARALFGMFALLTSIYCLLAYIPDLYFAFIQAPFQPWLVMFIAWHPYIYGVLLAALGAAMIQAYSGLTRRLAIEFFGAHTLLGVYFLIYRPFSHVRSNSLSYLWSLAWLFPLLWIGILDYCENSERESEPDTKLIQIPISSALIAGLAVALLDPASAWLRSEIAGRAFPLKSIDFIAWGWAVLIHVLFALFAVCAFNVAGRLTEKLPARFGLRLAYSLAAIVGLGLLFQRVLLASIPFTGTEAAIYSAAVAISLVTFTGGLLASTNLARSKSKNIAEPRNWRETPAAQNAALGLVLLAAIYVVPALIGVMDWNSVLAKLWAVTLWIMLLALSHRIWPPRVSRRYPVWLLLAVSVAAFFTYQFSQGNERWQKDLGGAAFTEAAARHNAVDASYAAIRDLWTVAEEKPCDALCVFLKEQTGIPSPVQPVDVKLVADLHPTTDPKPNVFIIVVDSLRRDYLSPYNPAVTFTPNIAQFASESAVMRNSFTRYAGTTLSEPAIWAGTMMLHKHYVQPFSPMNNLEKLVETDGYDQFVTVDTVLRLLLKTPSQLHRLDASMTNWADQDLCRTAPEAQEMIDQRTDKNRPIFLYTQPQNIHVVSLERARKLRPPRAEQYPGFYASAATEISRLDGCFGKFIHYLKTRGLYDNSIVVLTADHGESYGDFGHTNHAFGLHPEVLKVPLIFHLPPALRKSMYYDPDAIAFNIDVTPTLYYLLGHRPIADDPRFGRPLFTLTREEHDRFQRDSYLVAVCYGPIYGLLGRQGQDLFVANEMEGTYEYYDLAHDPFGTTNLINSQVQKENQRQLRGYVQQVADLYHYRAQRFSLLSWMIR